MRVGGLLTFIVTIVGIQLLPCATGMGQIGPDASKPRTRSVPVMVRIGCLLTAGCFENLNGREATRNSTLLAISDIAREIESSGGITSSDPVVFGVDPTEAAEATNILLEKVTAELRRVPRTELLTKGPMLNGQHILAPMTSEFRARLLEYANGDDFFLCTLTFVAMRRANTELSDKITRAKVLWDLYKRYLKACHKGSLDSLGDARSRIVVLIRRRITGGYFPYCLGFNFAANYILTAHHCLVEPESIDLVVSRFKPSDPDAFVPRDGPLPQSKALVLGEPDRLFEIRRPVKLLQDLNFYPFERDRDAIVLELVAPNRARMANFPVGEPAQWGSVALAALFVEDKALSDALESGRPSVVIDTIAGGSAVNISPLCASVFSIKSTKPFVYHGCQSRFGYSGGPMFYREPGGRMVLIGVHTGSVSAADPVDGWPYAVLFPNYGLRLPAIVRRAMN